MTAFGWIIFMVSEEATSYITDGNICTHPRLDPFQFIFRLNMPTDQFYEKQLLSNGKAYPPKTTN